MRSYPVFLVLLASIFSGIAKANAAPIVHEEKWAIAETSDEAFSLAMNAADAQAQRDCLYLGYSGKPIDVTVGDQGEAHRINRRQWQASWIADYQCQQPDPVSDAIVIGEGHGRALSSMPAAQSIARSHALTDARNQCRAEFGLTGIPTINLVLTDTTECPGDRYCYATFIAQYNCW